MGPRRRRPARRLGRRPVRAVPGQLPDARPRAWLVLFEAGVRPLLEAPFAAGETIYVDFDDRGAQAQARWHAAEGGLPQDRIAILPDGGVPPSGSLLFLRFQECDYACDEVARWEEYRLSRASGP